MDLSTCLSGSGNEFYWVDQATAMMVNVAGLKCTLEGVFIDPWNVVGSSLLAY